MTVRRATNSEPAPAGRRGAQPDAEHDPDTTHWKDCGFASRNAERMTGSWCIGHSRFPLSAPFTNLASMGSVREFVDAFSITIDETLPVLQFMAKDLDTVQHTRGQETTQRPRPAGQVSDLPPAARRSTD